MGHMPELPLLAGEFVVQAHCFGVRVLGVVPRAVLCQAARTTGFEVHRPFNTGRERENTSPTTYLVSKGLLPREAVQAH